MNDDDICDICGGRGFMCTMHPNPDEPPDNRVRPWEVARPNAEEIAALRAVRAYSIGCLSAMSCGLCSGCLAMRAIDKLLLPYANAMVCQECHNVIDRSQGCVSSDEGLKWWHIKCAPRHVLVTDKDHYP